MLQEFGYAFEAIGTAAGFIMAYFVLRQNPKYIGNRLMAASTVLISSYIGSILIYDLVATELAIQVFYRIGLVCIMMGSNFMYFTMQVMVHSSSWLRKKWKTWPLVGAVIGFGIYISLIDFITINDLEIVDTQIDLIPLAIVSLWVIITIFTTIVDLYTHGIKKVKGETKKHMMLFFYGLIINFGAVFLTVASNLVESDRIGTILDVVFFSVLALGMGVMTIGFMRKKKPKETPNFS